MITLAYPVVKEILFAVKQRLTWGELLLSLMKLRDTIDWEIEEETPIRKRYLTKMARPKLFNVVQLTLDCVLFMLTGKLLFSFIIKTLNNKNS